MRASSEDSSAEMAIKRIRVRPTESPPPTEHLPAGVSEGVFDIVECNGSDYTVRWAGFDQSEDTLHTREQLMADCPDTVMRFETRQQETRASIPESCTCLLYTSDAADE